MSLTILSYLNKHITYSVEAKHANMTRIYPISTRLPQANDSQVIVTSNTFYRN